MKPKLLPIGRQDFKTLIEDGCIYVDKTDYNSDWKFDKYPVIDFYFNAISILTCPAFSG